MQLKALPTPQLQQPAGRRGYYRNGENDKQLKNISHSSPITSNLKHDTHCQCTLTGNHRWKAKQRQQNRVKRVEARPTVL